MVTIAIGWIFLFLLGLSLLLILAQWVFYIAMIVLGSVAGLISLILIWLWENPDNLLRAIIVLIVAFFAAVLMIAMQP